MMNQLSLSEYLRRPIEEVAVLEQEPEYFESEGLLSFTESYDDLDWYKIALFTDSKGQAFGIKRYRNCPSPGVFLLAEQTHSLSLHEQIEEALQLLGLSGASVVWAREDAHWLTDNSGNQ
jgi:predicted ATPase